MSQIESEKCYDYAILGAGAAGLSLAYRMLKSPVLQQKKILILEKSPKIHNDRTWSIWNDKKTIFDPIISQRWKQFWFHNANISKLIDLEEFEYQKIRGIDFYNFTLDFIQTFPNVEIRYEAIQKLDTEEECVSIQSDQNIYQAKWVFNSVFLDKKLERKKGFHYIQQHFLGWRIQTKHDVFNPQQATFMDFRLEQKGQARFVYILPETPQVALVEFTVFSENLLEREEYEEELQNYIANQLNIKEFDILEEEFDVIPMYDQDFPKIQGQRIINIGTAGGQARPSTGYTFKNIQKQTTEIVERLEKDLHPYQAHPLQKRFLIYDGLLLNILQKQEPELQKLFGIMFQKHPVQRIFNFLDGESHFGQELQIMNKMPYAPFLKGIPKVVGRYF